MICPNCKHTVPWWGARQHIKCNYCSAQLVMANRTAFNVFIIFGALILTPLWAVSPYIMGAAILIEITVAWLFAEKLLYYKIVSKT